jgi:DNA topoisomerase-1
LRIVGPDDLTWSRRRRGKIFGYLDDRGTLIRGDKARKRLASLAVPPAYEDVRYAADPQAHLQAVARDAAGRLQYRYHPAWEKVREQRKAQRLLRLTGALPALRKHLARHLAARKPTPELALAAVIELIAVTGLRPGGETYLRQHGTRGAVTLLKRNVKLDRDCLAIEFTGKGGKHITKRCKARALMRAVEILRALPGRRLFQYRDEAGQVCRVRDSQVNAFMREMAGCNISLKDLRTLRASSAVMEMLAAVEPARSASARRKQVLEAVRKAAEELGNTPAICRRSYVHQTVVNAFEAGKLKAYGASLKRARSPAKRESVLAKVVAAQAPA